VSVTLVAQPISNRKEDRVLCYTISLSPRGYHMAAQAYK
jgi:hypothetical protein